MENFVKRYFWIINVVMLTAMAYLTARLKRSGAALSATDAPGVVRAAGAPDDLADHLGRLLEQGEAVRYGGASGAGIADAIAAWIDDADRSWK